MSGPIPAIFGLRKELGFDDDTARDFYAREVGKRSLREMSVGEQVKVMQALQRQVRGDTRGAGAAAQHKLDGPYAGKLAALWISGWNLGVVRVRTDAAMLGFLERQTGIQHTRFLRDAGDARRAIEALKAWLARDAGVDWSGHEEPEDAVLWAQGKLLGFDRGSPLNDPEAIGWDSWRLGGPVDRRALMQGLGRRIRGGAGDKTRRWDR